MNLREIGLYLKIRGEIDPNTLELIKGIYPEAERAPKIYSNARVEIAEEADGLRIVGTDIVLKGSLAKRHLGDCREIFIVLATLGMESERKMKETYAISPTKGVVLDACYSELLERRLDGIEEELSADGTALKQRISCGYGDLPLETQRPLLDLLNAKKIGVFMNESCMLTPNKSVIALIGIKGRKNEF